MLQEAEEPQRPMAAPTSLHAVVEFFENVPDQVLPLVCTCVILAFALVAYWWCSLPTSRFGATKANLLAESRTRGAAGTASANNASATSPSHGIPGGAPPGSAGWRQTDPATAWGKPVLLAIATFGTMGFAWEMLGQRHHGRDRFEAHTMLSGVPECRRDGPLCAGPPLGAASTHTLNYTSEICCRDVMLRMLVEVGDWLDKSNVEWYVGFNTLRDGVQFGALSPMTESLDIIVPSLADQEKLRSQQDIPYRFGYYGDGMLRGAANYPGVAPKLPHHVSSEGARMWINDRVPFVPLVSCEGESCAHRKLPFGANVPRKSSSLPDSMYSGQTAFYVMDVYSGTSDPDLSSPACGAFDAEGRAPRSSEKVTISGRAFPTHQNWEKCLGAFYGRNWRSTGASAAAAAQQQRSQAAAVSSLLEVTTAAAAAASSGRRVASSSRARFLSANEGGSEDDAVVLGQNQ